MRSALKTSPARKGLHDGFTLIEAMIACSVFALCIVGVVTSFTMTLRALHSSQNHYRAVAMARNRVQRARGFDFESLALLEEDGARVDRYGNIRPQDGRFRRSTEVVTGENPYTFLIKVSVSYPIGTSTNLSAPVVLDNLIATRM